MPTVKPWVNQCWRCCEVPWLNVSGRGTVPLRERLQVVVPEGCRGVQGGVDIARFQPVQCRLLRMVRPDAGQAVGLQFRREPRRPPSPVTVAGLQLRAFSRGSDRPSSSCT